MKADQPSVLCLIPARGGSKGIPKKNLRTLAGKPLIAYSIEHALNCRSIYRMIVSTDSEEIAAVAIRYGAEVPFVRPAAISGDDSTDLEVFQHALLWLKENENYIPDLCAHLRPTCPIRKVEDIENVVRLLEEHPELDSVRTVAIAPATPFKMWFRDESGRLTNVVQTEIKDAHNQPRQLLPEVFLQNASIDVVRAKVIMAGSMTGKTIYGYVMESFFDIDTEADLEEANEYLLSQT